MDQKHLACLVDPADLEVQLIQSRPVDLVVPEDQLLMLQMDLVDLVVQLHPVDLVVHQKVLADQWHLVDPADLGVLVDPLNPVSLYLKIL